MKIRRLVLAAVAAALILTFCCGMGISAFAAEEGAPAAAEAAGDNVTGTKALAAALAVGITAAAGALGMALAIGKSTEAMARQPEAAEKINSAMMLGLVFIETAIIYALIVAILVIFVL